MKNKQYIKKINDFCDHLVYKLNNVGSSSYGRILYDIEKKEARENRNYNEDQKHSVTSEAKFFLVRHILETITNKERFDIKSVLFVRQSCIYANSISLNYEKEIKEVIKEFDFQVNFFLENYDWNIYINLLENPNNCLK